MDRPLATLEDLQIFFAFPPNVKDPERTTKSALKRLGVSYRGNTVPWAAVFDALLIQSDLHASKLRELRRPLLTAAEVAARAGVHLETIHRWHRHGEEDLPAPVSLGGPRGTRWIRAEIEAWQGLRAPICFPRRKARKAKFGALKP